MILKSLLTWSKVADTIAGVRMSSHSSDGRAPARHAGSHRFKSCCEHYGRIVNMDNTLPDRHSCLECNEPFEEKDYRGAKFCSRSCAATFNNRAKPKRKRIARLYNCLNCGEELTKPSQKRYCTTKCQQANLAKKRLEEWLNGGNGSDAHGDLKPAFRRFLLKQCDNKCSKCEWGEVNPYSGKIYLTIDHIDGDATNNRYVNLRVLCYNCHTLTPTFNELNRGKGTRYETAGMRSRRLARMFPESASNS